MGNCLSIQPCVSEDPGPSYGDLCRPDATPRRSKRPTDGDQPAISQCKLRGAKVCPGGQGEAAWSRQGACSCVPELDSEFPPQPALSPAPDPRSSPLQCLAASCSTSSSASSCGVLFPEGSIHDDFILGEKLGSGRFGTVVACTRRSDGRRFACKIVSNSSGARDASMEVDVLQQMRGCHGVVQLEAVYLKKASCGSRKTVSRIQRPGSSKHHHRSAWKLEAAGLQESRQVEVEEVHIVMERCYGGTLSEILKAKGFLPEEEALCVIQSVLGTIHLLHAQGFIYRDIKDTNFLFHSDETGSAIVAIDFGLAAQYKQGDVLNEVAGSPLYIAPEVVHRAYGPQCDVWSAGVLLYQLLCGRQPFERDSLTAVLRAVTTDGDLDFESEPWPSVSDGTKKLLCLMLTRDPLVRPTPAQLLDYMSQGGHVQIENKAPDISGLATS